MSTPKESHAFISYVHEDSEAVDGLEAALEAGGVKVWRDKNNLAPGDDWKRVIREAIQGNALAFIPCFSATANAKDRSVMREEIHLAIGEYKLRPPDRPWILSVRFDDCHVPDFDLAPGKTLTDLNWTNLFGRQFPSELIKLVDRVKELLGTTTDGASTIAAVGEASDRVRGNLIAATVREGSADAAKAADGDRLVRAEARKVVEAIEDDDRLPTHPEVTDSAAGLARLQELTALSEPLIEASVAIGAFGQSAQARLATEVVNSLGRVGTSVRGGVQTFLDARMLPVSLVMTAGALGAVASENAATFAAFVARPEISTNYSATVPIHELVSPWHPYGDTRLASLYLRTVEGQKADPADYDNAGRGGDPYLPPQAVLKSLMRPHLRDLTIDDAAYSDLYSRMEVISGMVAYDWAGPHVKNIQYSNASNWVGRHIVEERYANPDVAQRVAAEIDQQARGWWGLREGFMFGGDPWRAEDALTAYMDGMSQLRTRLHG